MLAVREQNNEIVKQFCALHKQGDRLEFAIDVVRYVFLGIGFVLLIVLLNRGYVSRPYFTGYGILLFIGSIIFKFVLRNKHYQALSQLLTDIKEHALENTELVAMLIEEKNLGKGNESPYWRYVESIYKNMTQNEKSEVDQYLAATHQNM